MVLDNDTRGWIMACVSGVACVVGSSIICVDVIIRQFPGKRNFSIADSNTFLSASLSMSFGVMLFSSLYGMLPSSKKFLTKGGYSPQAAAYMLIGLFLLGVVGIQIISRVIHYYIPSHVVDCAHTHDEEGLEQDQDEMEESHPDHTDNTNAPMFKVTSNADSEDTPLLSRDSTGISPPKSRKHRSAPVETTQRPDAPFLTAPSTRRPSLQTRLTRTFTSFAAGTKASCDEGGPCFGYSDPCGQECFKAAGHRASVFAQNSSLAPTRHPTFARSSTNPYIRTVAPVAETDEESSIPLSSDTTSRRTSTHSHPPHSPRTHSHPHPHTQNGTIPPFITRKGSTTPTPPEAHHHHVPTNAFLNIGLQTSLAIALHKLPEGFITYATNHANPTLGFAIFMALFIHNITEGFAMALPLFLALNSRWKAMFWSSLLGGVSQPIGAGLAALWFKVAGGSDFAPGARVYGGMFAATAGVMTSVALQLFSEGLGLTHNRNLCVGFAFAGMGILGLSFALTA